MIPALFGLVVVGGVTFRVGRAFYEARRYAADGHGDRRILGACHSKGLGIRTSIPLVVMEITATKTRFLAFPSERQRSIGEIPTHELELEWSGTRLTAARHPRSGTTFWPRWSPVDPATVLTPGLPTVDPT